MKPWFTENHTRQHSQICPDRISCNLEIKPLFYIDPNAVRPLPLQPHVSNIS